MSDPFSDSRYYRDSSMFLGEVVEHTTTWLTINPYKGCPLKCAYCFRVRWGANDRPANQVDVETAVYELLSHPKFIPHSTPISVNISSTDALLPEVRESTIKVIEILEQRRLRNPFGITTKLAIPDQFVDLLASLVFLRPIIFISLAFIPDHIEPVPIEPRVQNFQKLSRTKIPVVHYFRPLVTGWNDSDDILCRGLLLGESYANAICIGSLRMSGEIAAELKEVGVDVSRFHDNFHEKRFESDIEQRVLSMYKKLGMTKPLFKHTSCAVSFLLKMHNYNHLFKYPEKNCVSTCPEVQQNRCKEMLNGNV